MRTVTGKQGSDARIHLLAAAGTGVLTAGVLGFFAPWQITAMISLIVATLVFLTWTWLTIWGMNAEDTRGHANTEGPSGGSVDSVVIVTCLAVLLVVSLVIFRAGHTGKSWDGLALALGVGCVMAGWFLVHTIFTLRYARQYYYPDGTGEATTDVATAPINFNQSDTPQYSDFAYMAFGVGVAFQVSDTNLCTPPVRRSVLGHSLVSFLFGAVIVGVTINLIAGLSQ